MIGKEQNRKKLMIQIAVTGLLSIVVVFFFLFSIKSVLLSESKQRLIEINQENYDSIQHQESLEMDSLDQQVKDITVLENSNTKQYFDDYTYSFILDEKGRIIAAFGEKAAQRVDEIENDLSQLLANTVEQYKEQGEQIEKMILGSGKEVYVATQDTTIVDNGYLITMVEKSVVDQEINSIFRISIAIVILAMTSITFAIAYNIYRQRRYRRRLVKLGEPDYVTGLMNYFSHKALAQRMVSEEKHTYAYVSVAIDRFSLISELNNKRDCNLLLKSVANHISSMISQEETVARVYDNVFGMLLLYEDELRLRQRLIHMLKAAGNIPKVNNNFCNITFHSGVCVVGKETNIDKVIRCAQKARVSIGIQSIANINFYGHKKAKQEHHKLVKEAIDAIYEERLTIFLQPKYRVDSEKITGAEAFVRWNHPVNGILSPNVFLPLLEKNGTIVQVDFYVLKMVCRTIKEWLEANKQPVTVSINLSIQHLDHPSFVQKMVNLVDDFQVPHALIEFEFPETAIYEKQEKLIDAMRRLSSLGFIISIDNFGAGFSSIHLLKELPIHLIKIDKGLIRDLEDSEFADKERTLVTHIITLAKEMHVGVVAEGVETKAQRDLLKQEDCDIIQGYYYQKPMPAAEFSKLLVTAE